MSRAAACLLAPQQPVLEQVLVGAVGAGAHVEPPAHLRARAPVDPVLQEPLRRATPHHPLGVGLHGRCVGWTAMRAPLIS
jgi:hypothetical protein